MTLGIQGPPLTGNESIVWKTEGLSDLASLLMIMPRDHTGKWIHGVWTNGHGAKETPEEWLCEQFAGTEELFVVHDCDEAGQIGATGDKNFGPNLARYAKTVRNVVLPYPITKSDGKDLTNWIFEQKDAGKSHGAIFEELLAMARASQRITPCSKPIARGVPSTVAANGDTAGSDDDDDTDDTDDENAAGTLPLAVIEHDDDPHRLARVNLEEYRKIGGKLVCYADEFWRYRNGVYRRITEADLRAKVTATIRKEFERCWRQQEADRLEEEKRTNRDITPEPILRVTRNLVNNVIDATRSMCRLPSSTVMPSWLPTAEQRPYLSLGNGILDLEAVFAEKPQSESLLPHSPNWFSCVKAPYDFDEDADCPTWKNFLNQVFNDDAEQIEALQKWFGYVLTQQKYLHKMLLLIGRPRSGKGTIARTLRLLIGKESVGNPTLSQMAGQYELDGLVDKSLAIVGDARLSRKTDESVITERLLSITGGDPQDIQRKYMSTQRGVEMAVRFMLLSNELPSLTDASAAIVSRCILLNMPNTYEAAPDYGLGDKIEKELPGVLWWAIVGAGKLRESKVIEQPTAGISMLKSFRTIVSPVSQFVAECCKREGEATISQIFEAFVEWTKRNDVEPLTKPVFAKKLLSSVPSIKRVRQQIDYEKVNLCHGISLKPDSDLLF